MRRSTLVFLLVFGAGVGLTSVLLRHPSVERGFVVPFTAMVARASGVALGLLGLPNEVRGTLIRSPEGFSLNIVNGCNGVSVMAILAAAVLAFPSSWKEKGIGLALGIPGVQIINLIRIVSLYYIGLRHPALFGQFHLFVWQTAVIVLTMALWIFWAEILVAAPARQAEPRRGPAAGV